MMLQVQLLVCAIFPVYLAAPHDSLAFPGSLADAYRSTNEVFTGRQASDGWWSPDERGWPSSILPWARRMRRSAGVAPLGSSSTSSRYIKSLVKPGPSTAGFGQHRHAASQHLPQTLPLHSPLLSSGVSHPQFSASRPSRLSPLGTGLQRRIPQNRGLVNRNLHPPLTGRGSRVITGPTGTEMGVPMRMGIGSSRHHAMGVGSPMGSVLNRGLPPGMMAPHPNLVPVPVGPEMMVVPPGFHMARDHGGAMWLVPHGGGLHKSPPVPIGK